MRTIGRVGMAAVVAGVVVLASALAWSDEGATETPSGDDAAGDVEKIVLKDGDDGKEVTLKVGQTLEITLESNPTTGFGWETLEIEPAIVEQQGEKVYTPRKTDGEMVGSGGSETFTFKATKAGAVELKLVYRRAWEKDVAPEKTFTITVTVEE